jgi:hypothetical protein
MQTDPGGSQYHIWTVVSGETDRERGGVGMTETGKLKYSERKKNPVPETLCPPPQYPI